MGLRETIFKHALCCSCNNPVDEKTINLVILPYYATWEYPFSSNLLIENYGKRAMAVVHKYCLEKEILYAVEIVHTVFIYHSVDELERVPDE